MRCMTGWVHALGIVLAGGVVVTAASASEHALPVAVAYTARISVRASQVGAVPPNTAGTSTGTANVTRNHMLCSEMTVDITCVAAELCYAASTVAKRVPDIFTNGSIAGGVMARPIGNPYTKANPVTSAKSAGSFTSKMSRRIQARSRSCNGVSTSADAAIGHPTLTPTLAWDESGKS